jgi:hypothetical protein
MWVLSLTHDLALPCFTRFLTHIHELFFFTQVSESTWCFDRVAKVSDLKSDGICFVGSNPADIIVFSFAKSTSFHMHGVELDVTLIVTIFKTKIGEKRIFVEHGKFQTFFFVHVFHTYSEKWGFIEKKQA